MVKKLIPRRRRTWIELVTNEGDSLRLPREHVPASLVTGATLSENRWQELSTEARYYKLLDIAVRILGRREHFFSELKLKLRQRERDRELVTRVLSKLQELNYIDEERAAELVVTQLMAKGGIGRARLKHELYKRGCPVALIDKAIEKYASALDDISEARRLLEAKRDQFQHRLEAIRRREAKKKLPRHKAAFAERQQLYQYVNRLMITRGFSDEDTKRTIRQLVDELVAEV